MAFGVTDEGYEGKRLADIIEEAEEDLSLITDPSSGERLDADFSSDDPAMQIAKVPLVGVADCWETSKLIYDQFNPSLAVGPSLSGLVQINGIGRQEASASSDTAVLTGSAGAIIPAGQIIADEFSTREWITDSEVMLDVTGQAEVGITNTVTGPVDVAPGVLNKIVTPQPGWQTVSNNGAVSLGNNIETDSELRVRRSRSTLAPAAAPAESVWANLSNLRDVSYVRVLINNTLSEDARGIPAKTQAVIIVGGDDEEIATTILQRSGAGIEFFGTQLVTIYDAQDEPYLVFFTRPAPVDIYINLELAINQNIFPSNGDELIRQAIIAYARGGAPEINVFEGFREIGFGPGSTVIYTRLFTPINSVAGHRVNAFEISADGVDFGQDDISIGVFSYPRFLAENINITIEV
ncbi:hypothetical protein F9L16_23885 [Agarivorans sp. B2Z047]|uniref:baseplate J/gp47 family protein n=1 Tax=Agarivorans sp. B2Z047 TaxID=2652721 RepID=UPI00128AEC19|nr:baseplate J/gp47 family protein [Agarivorans sp. B2Z047]MPW31991.1 hypothetical protein [Agarivorans sp. B2Z047]UQN41863.1 baseplate J/gp47 family protein [Agarivorans sp. B2Z047]